MTMILDCTLRDGGHQNNWNFDDEFVCNLINKLKNKKIDYCEIGYRNKKDKADKGRFASSQT